MRLCVSLLRGVAAPLGCVILVRMLIALLGGPVANFPALWYDKFNKLESVMHWTNYVGRKPVHIFLIRSFVRNS